MECKLCKREIKEKSYNYQGGSACKSCIDQMEELVGTGRMELEGHKDCAFLLPITV